ncbi:hypothetical protein GPLA_2214 [Paraglaciecola polaris LMG 21857]|uniref:Uncharacterized protein n=1 Tax=Paraglaciecola polaris LMG 21857 TaxID=1129793 RepID=K6YK82_9ALTE|nr:hypothetical protein GPLA_2214 [Paraglaciecola polaris LMG 21857]|tara:strand:- start:4592 stop:4741 length:150 start_codon:yes stop_codon:yes gene_type:complete
MGGHPAHTTFALCVKKNNAQNHPNQLNNIRLQFDEATKAVFTEKSALAD